MLICSIVLKLITAGCYITISNPRYCTIFVSLMKLPRVQFRLKICFGYGFVLSKLVSATNASISNYEVLVLGGVEDVLNYSKPPNKHYLSISTLSEFSIASNPSSYIILNYHGNIFGECLLSPEDGVLSSATSHYSLPTACFLNLRQVNRS